MAVRLNDIPDALKNRSTFGFFEDFIDDVDSNFVVVTASDAGTGVVGDAVGGILPLVASDGTVADNDETYAELPPNEVFKFAADKPLIFEARVQFTEANTDDANILVGLLDAVAANSLQDNGGGPPASYSGAVFFKVDGGTRWQCETSNAGTQTTTDLSASDANNLSHITQTAGGASYQTLRIVFEPYSSTNAYVNFFIDGVHVAQHDYIFTSATEMQTGAGVKNGGANLETLNLDYVACYQAR